MPVATQEAQYNPQPGTIASGAATFPTLTRPSVGGQNPNIQVGNQPLVVNQLPAGSLMEPTGRVDMNNNPTAFVKNQTTGEMYEVTIPGGVPVNTMPGGMPTPLGNAQTGVQGGGVMPQNNIQAPRPAAPAATPANAPVRMPAGETPATLEAATNLRLQTRAMAQQVPVQDRKSTRLNSSH